MPSSREILTQIKKLPTVEVDGQIDIETQAWVGRENSALFSVYFSKWKEVDPKATYLILNASGSNRDRGTFYRSFARAIGNADVLRNYHYQDLELKGFGVLFACWRI